MKNSKRILLSNDAVKWLRSDHRGLSSEFMFEQFTGCPLIDKWDYRTRHHPKDPDDFTRCERLLREVPEFRPKLKKLKPASKVWSALIDNWDKINDLLYSEIPKWFEGELGFAPKTYKFMKTLGC